MHCGWPAAPLQLKNSRKQQNRTPRKPPAQPCHSTQCRLHHTCCAVQRLHLTLQHPMLFPGLATHTLAGLCALWLPSSASSTKKSQKAAKPQPLQTTCPALPQHPVQAPPHLLHTAEAAFGPAVPNDMPRAGYPHTGRALCTVVAEQRLNIWKTPAFSKTAYIPLQTTCQARPQHPVQAPPHLLHATEVAFDLACIDPWRAQG